MIQLLLATRNQHKTREFAQLLGENFTVRDLTSKTDLPAIVESGATFEENAVLKAVTLWRIFPREIVGADGIFSARYAGENAGDRRNVEKLLRELQDARDRSARFNCVVALARNGQVMTTIAGEVVG